MVCVDFAMLAMVRDSHKALHHAAFWLKKGSAQERGIVTTEPRFPGQQLGSTTPALNKEDSVLVLARECKCPPCMSPIKEMVHGAIRLKDSNLSPACC